MTVARYGSNAVLVESNPTIQDFYQNVGQSVYPTGFSRTTKDLPGQA